MIRPAKSISDWARIREICCATGKSGAAIEPSRDLFFGEFWIGPYRRFCADLAFVAESEGEVIGYLTGCANTGRFEFLKRFVHQPSLLLGVVARKYPSNADTRRFIRRYFRFDRAPEDFFSPDRLSELKTLYPAHLHINLDSKARGKGIGAQLVERFFDELRQRKTPGCHVFCGPGPVSFYEKLGFRIREKIEFKPGVDVFLLVREV